MDIPRYVLLDKAVGETPLQCMETWRAAQPPALYDLPLTYAGRLDPMASGKLLILIGEECKKKDEYLKLDKTYEFSVLFGIGSDTHDVLGRLETIDAILSTHREESDQLQEVVRLGLAPRSAAEGSGLDSELKHIAQGLTGEVELPYPHFSSKTVQGKPLHTWTLEGRLNEIEIPTKQSIIYNLELTKTESLAKKDLVKAALEKIDTIPPVTEARKALGNDFRRADVRADWERILLEESLPDTYTIAHFTCTASSGTYMRTLAKLIGERLTPSIPSLAWHIHRTNIGTYDLAAHS